MCITDTQLNNALPDASWWHACVHACIDTCPGELSLSRRQ